MIQCVLIYLVMITLFRTYRNCPLNDLKFLVFIRYIVSMLMACFTIFICKILKETFVAP